MKAPRGRRFTPALLVALVLPVSARAGWLPDGIPVGSGAGDQSSAQAIADGTGDVIIVWRDRRGSDYDIYIQRLGRDGNALWTPNGVAVCAAIGHQEGPSIASDGAGGAIVSWSDARTGDAHIYAQRVDGSGVPLWDTDGHPVCTAPGHHTGSTVLADGAGGAFIAWNFGFAASTDVYLQRVDAAGNDLWNPNGVGLSTAVNYQFGPRMVSDDAGGVLVAWGDRRSGSWQVFGARASGGGNVLWTANGVLLSGAISGSTTPVIEVDRDGTGGMLVAWHYGDGGRVQRVSSTSALQWGASGLNLAALHVPAIAGDGAGGAFVAWDVGLVAGTEDVRLQHVAPTGAGAWLPNGITIGGGTGSQSSPRLAVDGVGGVVTLWSDTRNGVLPQLFAQRVDIATGVESWPANGVPVSMTPVLRTLTNVIPTNEVGMVAVWHDGDVYAQRVHSLSGDWGAPDALVTGVADIPGDEGGFVQVDWDASDRDGAVATTVTHYSLWRATDFIPAGATLPAAPPPEVLVASRGDVHANFRATAYYVQSTPAGTCYWEWVGNTTATGAAEYSAAAPTRQDAVEGDPATHYLQVLAHTADSFVLWESNVMTGSSTDDLAPASPLSLIAVRDDSDVDLQWSPSGQNEPDFADYAVYRADTPGVPTTPGNLVASTTGTTLTDTGVQLTALYYVVVARDVHGNRSEPSNEAVIATVTGVGTPALTSLQVGPNAPNPFSVSTRFSVGLPEAASVSIEVFDVAGRRVAWHRATPLGAGWSTVKFNGRDDSGRLLPNGVYFWRATAGSETRVRKIVVQR
jgi:hypothetical protein